jgi:uncharacterized 2Fe-2S/4Fe-4S cluster protein (DUF4445 family)
MPVIRLPEHGKTIDYVPGPSLLDLLSGAGLMPPSPCGAAGECGKCAVTILAGDLPPPTPQEAALLPADELARGRRLACLVRPQGDLAVEVIPDHDDAPFGAGGSSGHILAWGRLPAFALAPALEKRLVALAADAPDSPEDRLAAALGLPALPAWVSQGLDLDATNLTAVFDDGELAALRPGDETGRCLAMAVDLGTTTVAAALLDLRTGREVAVKTALNPQKRWGFDVLTRIGHVMEHPGEGLAALQGAVIDCLNELARGLAEAAGLPTTAIDAVSVAANTAMLHLLLGVDPSPLAMAPFTPAFTQARRLPASDLGLTVANGAMVYCLPSVSAFIGADIVAGLYVAGLHEARDTALFLDIGTNGEMALAHGGRIRACSCAAGPALEGMNISCGVRACSGAVEDVRLGPTGPIATTIGGRPPIGLCGSGLLAAVSELLRVGLVSPRGNLAKARELPEHDWRRALLVEKDGRPAVRVTDGEAPLVLTQRDIRQVQLAKGALSSGVAALLARHGLGAADVDRVLVAGQFGAHLPAASLTGCGILPPSLGDKVDYCGNTSQSGASLALLRRDARPGMEALAREVGFFDLSRLDGFDRLFADCLRFPVPA